MIAEAVVIVGIAATLMGWGIVAIWVRQPSGKHRIEEETELPFPWMDGP